MSESVKITCSIIYNYGSMGDVKCSNLRQFHSHEHSGHEKAQQHADKADEEQKEAVEFGNVWGIGAIQDYKAKATHSEQKAGGQTLHDVLSIHPLKEKICTFVKRSHKHCNSTQHRHSDILNQVRQNNTQPS